MSPVDAFMPATAALHRQVAAAAPAPRKLNDEPVMHKYIIVRDAFSQTHSSERIIVFSKDLQHKNMVPIGCDALSAGFVAIYEGRVVVPGTGSETLKLEPRARDQKLLSHFLGLPS